MRRRLRNNGLSICLFGLFVLLCRFASQMPVLVRCAAYSVLAMALAGCQKKQPPPAKSGPLPVPSFARPGASSD